MDRGDGPPHRIVEQHWDAVGRKDGQADAGTVCGQPVSLKGSGIGGAGTGVGRAHGAHQIPVDLVVFDQNSGIRACGGAEAAEIFRHMAGRIPAGGPQVQAVPRRGGDAPQPGGKAVGRARPGGVCAGIKGDAAALY